MFTLILFALVRLDESIAIQTNKTNDPSLLLCMGIDSTLVPSSKLCVWCLVFCILSGIVY